MYRSNIIVTVGQLYKGKVNFLYICTCTCSRAFDEKNNIPSNLDAIAPKEDNS